MDASTRRSGPDLEGLADHVRAFLASSLPDHVHYHDVAHTFRDVVPAAERLSVAENLPARERLRVVAAAILHDVGHVHDWEEHERASAAIARDVLPRFGFGDEDVEAIARLVLATRIGHVPETNAEAVIMDADLDILGREDFWPKNLLLRQELLERGVRYSDVAWWRGQRRFLARHVYRTASAKESRGSGKRANLLRVQDLVRRLLAERAAREGASAG